VVVGLAAWRVDARVRDREAAAVAACARAGQSDVVDAHHRLSAMYGYVSPTLESAIEPALRAALLRLLATTADGVREPVRADAAACGAVRVWLWHRPQRDARTAWVIYVAAEADQLDAVAASGGAYTRLPTLAPLLTQARDRLARAAA
jgi:hypothetical protein